MTWLLFPDNTVLVNFAHLGRMTLLGELVRDRGRWTASVAEECAMSSEVPGLESLVDAPLHLGEPLFPESPTELLDTERFRLELSRPGDHRFRNLGEAETLSIIVNRFRAGAAFVSDDETALGKAKSLGIRNFTTATLVVLAVRTQRLELDEGWNGLVRLRSIPRSLPRCPTNYHEFSVQCRSTAAA